MLGSALRAGRDGCRLAVPSCGKQKRCITFRRQQPQAAAGDAIPAADDAVPASEEKKPGISGKIGTFLLGGKFDKERLKALGVGALISYGFISNVTYGACVTIVWGAHVAATGQTPLAPGQWTGFLARLAALMALQNVLRPLRFSLAVAMTPFVDRLMGQVQDRLNISKAKAFGVMMFVLGVSTTTALVTAICIATHINMPSTPLP